VSSASSRQILRFAQDKVIDDLLRLFPDLRKVPLPAYVVGGAVRDLLLGRHPADADVASNDPLAAARALRHKVIRLGKADHLSAYRVVLGEHVYDFAELLDHDIDADLARRDFTINAMAVSLDDGTHLDPHGGRRDLEARIVRMVNAENFDDDPLRMLKAVRMAVTHRFAIDEATIDAIRPRAARINEVAAERVAFELSLIFSANAFDTAVKLLRRTGLDVALGLSDAECGAAEGGGVGVGERRRGRRRHMEDMPFELAMALLVDDPRNFGERWRWSEALIRDVTTLQKLMRGHDLVALYDAGERLARMIGEPNLPDFTIRPLLTGEEIGQLASLEPGPQLGRVKRAMLEAQIRGEVKTPEEAKLFVRAFPTTYDLRPTT
jgi:tRNA nucleotidyltransferase/poly(A) polymerase